MKKILSVSLVLLALLMLVYIAPVRASPVPVGRNFDNLVIVAMENRNICEILTTCGGTASFITSLAQAGAYSTGYLGYGAGGRTTQNASCSASCYTSFMDGNGLGVSDGYSCCITAPILMQNLDAAGLTWQVYCETGTKGCNNRGSDHFPFTAIDYTHLSTNVFNGISSTVSTTTFNTEANILQPPNLLWFTPTDDHNMHDNDVPTGNSYIQTFFVGTGTLANPSAGSLLASGLFAPGHRTLLMLWWDEYDTPLEVFYGPTVKQGFVSTVAYDHFSALRLIEDNWGLPQMSSNDRIATGMIADMLVPAITVNLTDTFLGNSYTTIGVLNYNATYMLGGKISVARNGQSATTYLILKQHVGGMSAFRINFFTHTTDTSGVEDSTYVYLNLSTGTITDHFAGRNADINKGGTGDIVDISFVNSKYGKCVGQSGYDPAADLNGGGCVDTVDLGIVNILYGFPAYR